MKLLVRAADYGMTDGITSGCYKAMKLGVLKDVELFSNNLCGERAANLLKEFPDVSVGIAINIVSGKPITKAELIPSLVNEQGRFITSKERKKMGLLEVNYEEVMLEVENQVKRFIELVGKVPLYMAEHAFMSNNINKAMDEIAGKYSTPRDWADGCGVSFGDRWYAREKVYSYEQQASADVLGYILNDKNNMLSQEYAMLSFHCGYCDGELLEMSTFNVVRGVELTALCSDSFRKWIKDNKIELINMETLMRDRYKKRDYGVKNFSW